MSFGEVVVGGDVGKGSFLAGIGPGSVVVCILADEEKVQLGALGKGFCDGALELGFGCADGDGGEGADAVSGGVDGYFVTVFPGGV